MKKIIVTLALSIVASATVQAYYTQPINCGQSSAVAQYYSGQISTEQYVDSLIGTRRSINVNHSDGTWSTIQPYTDGSGYIKHSNGTWSTYSPY